MKSASLSKVRSQRSRITGRAQAGAVLATVWREFQRARQAQALYQDLSRASDHALAARGLRRSEIASFVKRALYSDD